MGAIIVVMVVGGAWVIFVGASRSGKRVMEYASTLEGAASIQAYLLLDLASASVPLALNSQSTAFKVEDEGRKVQFLSIARERDPEGIPAGGHVYRSITWRAVPEGDGFVLERTPSSGEGQRWEGVRAKGVRFRIVHHLTDYYFEADMLFAGSTSAAVVDAKDFPLRVTRRLRPEAALSPGMLPFPHQIFSELPEPSTQTPRSLLSAAQRRLDLSEGSAP